MTADEQRSRSRYRTVFWIGGSTCAGKSTLVDMLSERFGVGAYHFDRREPFHIHRSIPEDQPTRYYRLMLGVLPATSIAWRHVWSAGWRDCNDLENRVR